jgi:hypothetical protein
VALLWLMYCFLWTGRPVSGGDILGRFVPRHVL